MKTYDADVIAALRKAKAQQKLTSQEFSLLGHHGLLLSASEPGGPTTYKLSAIGLAALARADKAP